MLQLAEHAVPHAGVFAAQVDTRDPSFGSPCSNVVFAIADAPGLSTTVSTADPAGRAANAASVTSEPVGVAGLAQRIAPENRLPRPGSLLLANGTGTGLGQVLLTHSSGQNHGLSNAGADVDRAAASPTTSPVPPSPVQRASPGRLWFNDGAKPRVELPASTAPAAAVVDVSVSTSVSESLGVDALMPRPELASTMEMIGMPPAMEATIVEPLTIAQSTPSDLGPAPTVAQTSVCLADHSAYGSCANATGGPHNVESVAESEHSAHTDPHTIDDDRRFQLHCHGSLIVHQKDGSTEDDFGWCHWAKSGIGRVGKAAAACFGFAGRGGRGPTSDEAQPSLTSRDSQVTKEMRLPALASKPEAIHQVYREQHLRPCAAKSCEDIVRGSERYGRIGPARITTAEVFAGDSDNMWTVLQSQNRSPVPAPASLQETPVLDNAGSCVVLRSAAGLVERPSDVPNSQVELHDKVTALHAREAAVSEDAKAKARRCAEVESELGRARCQLTEANKEVAKLRSRTSVVAMEKRTADTRVTELEAELRAAEREVAMLQGAAETVKAGVESVRLEHAQRHAEVEAELDRTRSQVRTAREEAAKLRGAAEVSAAATADRARWEAEREKALNQIPKLESELEHAHNQLHARSEEAAKLQSELESLRSSPVPAPFVAKGTVVSPQSPLSNTGSLNVLCLLQALDDRRRQDLMLLMPTAQQVAKRLGDKEAVLGSKPDQEAKEMGGSRSPNLLPSLQALACDNMPTGLGAVDATPAADPVCEESTSSGPRCDSSESKITSRDSSCERNIDPASSIAGSPSLSPVRSPAESPRVACPLVAEEDSAGAHELSTSEDLLTAMQDPTEPPVSREQSRSALPRSPVSSGPHAVVAEASSGAGGASVVNSSGSCTPKGSGAGFTSREVETASLRPKVRPRPRPKMSQDAKPDAPWEAPLADAEPPPDAPWDFPLANPSSQSRPSRPPQTGKGTQRILSSPSAGAAHDASSVGGAGHTNVFMPKRRLRGRPGPLAAKPRSVSAPESAPMLGPESEGAPVEPQFRRSGESACGALGRPGRKTKKSQDFERDPLDSMAAAAWGSFSFSNISLDGSVGGLDGSTSGATIVTDAPSAFSKQARSGASHGRTSAVHRASGALPANEHLPSQDSVAPRPRPRRASLPWSPKHALRAVDPRGNQSVSFTDNDFNIGSA